MPPTGFRAQGPCWAAPSVRLAGPRVVVFSGSSAQPHAWGSPSDGTSLWYTCNTRERVTRGRRLSGAHTGPAGTRVLHPARHSAAVLALRELARAGRARTIPLPSPRPFRTPATAPRAAASTRRAATAATQAGALDVAVSRRSDGRAGCVSQLAESACSRSSGRRRWTPVQGFS